MLQVCVDKTFIKSILLQFIMEKKTKFQIIAGVAGAIIFSIFGLIYFAGYGGNNCDQPPANTCDCFCCHMFNSRGFESCGAFGLWLGILVGVILGLLVIRLAWQKFFNI